MTIPTNPYIAGNPVGKTSCFVGRDDVLLAVENLLRHPMENAITLHGQRRIGKTSVLQYLAAHLQETGPYHPILFDLSHQAGEPLVKILRDLARAIAQQLNLPGDGFADITEEIFRDTFISRVIRSLPERDSLVLLLDEFDVLADPEAERKSKRQFFSYLNELCHFDPKHLQFVFVLGRNVDDLDVIASLLFKDIRSHRIALLGKEEAERLTKLSEQNGSLYWSAEAVTHIWELTCGHPYLTQALCSQIWEDAYHRSTDEPLKVSPELVEAAIEGTLRGSQHVFSWVWQGLGPAERIVASALAGMGQRIVDEAELQVILHDSGVHYVTGELQDAPQILKKWDLLVSADDGFCFSVELLRRWIAENKPLSRTIIVELDRINPVANSLYDAASGFYQINNIEEADRLLKQVLGLNPNHPHANDLYANILLEKENFGEAQVVLERLDEIVPGKARPRLRKIFLIRARASVDEGEKLEWYERILAKIPDDSEAQDGRKKIYQGRGERALQNKDFNAAIIAFQAIDDNEGYERSIKLRAYEQKLEMWAVIDSYEAAGRIGEAYKLIQTMVQRYPDDTNIRLKLQNLENQLALLEEQKAMAALWLGQPALGNYTLRKAITIDPFYENTSHYPPSSDSENYKPDSDDYKPDSDSSSEFSLSSKNSVYVYEIC